MPDAAGFPPPIEVSIYPGAYHAWTVPSLGAPDFYPQYRSTRKCPYLLLGPSPPLVADRAASERPMDPNVMQTCLKEGRGYSMAYDEAVAREVHPRYPGFSLEGAATLAGQATRCFCAATEPAHWSTGRGRRCRS